MKNLGKGGEDARVLSDEGVWDLDIIQEESNMLPISYDENDAPVSNLIEEDTFVICHLASAASRMILKDSIKIKDKKKRKNLCRRLLCCLRIEYNADDVLDDDLDCLRRVSTDKETIKGNPLFIRQDSIRSHGSIRSRNGSIRSRKMSVSETTGAERVVVYETVKSYCLSKILDEMF